MTRRTKSTNRIPLPKDPLLRLLTINAFAGVGVAGMVLACIMWFNIGNLQTLVLGAEDPFLPLAMLAFGLVITLASVVMGSAVMLLGEKRSDRDGDGRGGWMRFLEEDNLQPVPVRARAGRGDRRRD